MDRCRGTLKFVGDPPCMRRAQRDGYCHTHHPDTICAKRSAKRAQLDARTKALEQSANTRRRQIQLAALFHDTESVADAAAIVARGRKAEGT